MVTFAKLKVGDNFSDSSGKIWVKVTPVKKSCCTILLNAKLVEDQSVTRIFKPAEMVTQV